ncbi:MAG: NifB/NifX family molybdenum-iron cluster-binding protein [Syntrophotaleaceae bacterium]
MKVCFPVAKNKGLQSEIYGHFSSAPLFLIVDSETREIEEVENCDPANPFHGCNPQAALNHRELGAIVVDGVADAVLQVMSNLHGLMFFAATTYSLEQSLEQLLNHQLDKIEPFYSQNEGRCGGDDEDSCGDHDHDHEEEEEVCVNHGGSGCANHGSNPCTSH